MRVILLSVILSFPILSVFSQSGRISVGADRSELYLKILEGKNIGLVANHTSMVGDQHLVDHLLDRGIKKENIAAVFAPEHGFRGGHAAGAKVKDGVDPQTGLKIISLYGSNKKPAPEVLAALDLMIFDMQDVGARFYTYISTLHYVMEACSEADLPLMILDRPNPNGDYVDGPVRQEGYRSFVGMHPIPVVHGLTMAELAQMINGEGWLAEGRECRLHIIPCLNYSHTMAYALPVPPSPNLQNDHAVRLYPSTCFFEGSVLSEGRGTPWPFEVYGHPLLKGDFSFTPEVIPGVAEYPKWEAQLCYGRDLRSYFPEGGHWKLDVEIFIQAFNEFPNKNAFFKPFFDKLAGTDQLRKQIESGLSATEIRAGWTTDIEDYKLLRKKYLLYD